MATARFSVLVFLSSLVLLATICVSADVSPGFYLGTCSQLTTTVRREVSKILLKDPNLAGALSRLQFHDCWVNGCDGSVLLQSTATNVAERDGFANFELRGIVEIDKIKAAVEAVCPETVSCADIIALAARDATVFVGGLSWPVDLGRRDSRVSVSIDADTNLPFPVLNFDQLVQNFAAKGFNSKEMVILSGAHTIGRTHCNGVAPNLYNFSGIEDLTNPNLDPDFAAQLKQKCPKGNRLNIVDMDQTKNRFDRNYFRQVLAGKGVFITDDALVTNSFGLSVVTEAAQFGSSFFQDFADGMRKMSNLGVLTGTQGEIRKHCQFVN